MRKSKIFLLIVLVIISYLCIAADFSNIVNQNTEAIYYLQANIDKSNLKQAVSIIGYGRGNNIQNAKMLAKTDIRGKNHDYIKKLAIRQFELACLSLNLDLRTEKVFPFSRNLIEFSIVTDFTDFRNFSFDCKEATDEQSKYDCYVTAYLSYNKYLAYRNQFYNMLIELYINDEVKHGILSQIIQKIKEADNMPTAKKISIYWDEALLLAEQPKSEWNNKQ